MLSTGTRRLQIVACACLLIPACRQLRPDPEELVRGILADFVYVGSAATAEASEVPPHGSKSLPLPQHFVSHRAYVFHRRNETETAPIWQVLQNRMGAASIRVSAAPQGARGLIYSYV